MRKITVIFLVLLLLAGCKTKEEESATYTQISMSELMERLETQKDAMLVDVRTIEEYESGHIPGAICIPNETIKEEEIVKLPDKNQTIFVYCRSGNRSKQAAESLIGLGYTNVVECGGIADWTGEVVTGSE